MDARLVGQEHARGLHGDDNCGLRQDSSCGPSSSLAGAVVDEVLDPVRMLPGDGAPEEALVRSATAPPLIRKALQDSREPSCVGPDPVDGELWPVGDLEVLRGVVLVLHLLLAPEELLQEDQRAVVLLGQEEALRESGQRRGREGLTVFSTRYL